MHTELLKSRKLLQGDIDMVDSLSYTEEDARRHNHEAALDLREIAWLYDICSPIADVVVMGRDMSFDEMMEERRNRYGTDAFEEFFNEAMETDDGTLVHIGYRLTPFTVTDFMNAKAYIHASLTDLLSYCDD